ncbi:SDR family oxidoreductase [Cognatiyoonia sp. IB215182]|uniref:SDR family oxidoreductase n=1 Tax=Cognatiyoonia sp. IB215182 TaxID=3097353 RepID=UPI002A107145|nr:SDR family oxidoreductase [Cognatiyoonia sp. IB215182]MDX8355113.1 SDR family oxidoreductase [Cognatiyoonia sp. IB215182]
MRVFVTGATGYVGSAVVRELLDHDYSVIGLARSDASAETLKDAGAEAHHGNLEDLESLRAGAVRADAVIHLGFNHDFSKFAENCAHDAEVVRAIGNELAGSDRLFLATSGTAILTAGAGSKETDLAPTGDGVNPRVATEHAVGEMAQKGVKISAVRLAPSVHGAGDRGFVRMLADIATHRGEGAYIDEGQNRWCAVHRLDAARLYRLALERNEGGVHYHGVAEEGVPFKDIAEALGHSLDLPVSSKTGDDAQAYFDWFHFMAALDCPASGGWTREALNWTPTEPSLIADIDAGLYRPADERGGNG